MVVSLAIFILIRIWFITAVHSLSNASLYGDTFDVSKFLPLNGTQIRLADAGNTNQSILLSSDEAYSLQFFPSYANATQRLLVVLSTFFNTTVVWIANRDQPVSPSATLLLQLPSLTLALKDTNGTLVWGPSVANISTIVMNSTGNLYILGGGGADSGSPQWQSFDEPTDVFVPGQRLKTNHTSIASLAWNDWRSGHYTLKAEPGGAVLYASLDHQQTMVPYQILNYVTANNTLASSLHSACNHTDILYNYDASGVTLEQEGTTSPQCFTELNNTSSIHSVSFASRISGDGYRFVRVMPSGDINSFFLSNSTGLRLDNELFRGFYGTYCKLPSYCGINALCSETQTCNCPQLFEAIDPSDSTQGCRLQTPLNCSIFRQHQFLQVSGADYYANNYLTPRAVVNSPEDCMRLCLQNCSCTAAFHNNKTGACHFYDQVHTMQYGSSPDITAFLRVASLPPVPGAGGKDSIPKQVIIGVSVGVSVAVVSLVGLAAWISRKLMKAPPNDDTDSEEAEFLEGLPGLPPRFSYQELENATEGFGRQLGSGGSGAVYEGSLNFHSKSDNHTRGINRGQQQQQQVVRVAVKKLKLSQYSNIAAASKRQFRAEVATLGNVSHVNLVQLKGFCAEGIHRLLVYEFVENGSLDKWIFTASNDNSNGNAGDACGVVLPWEVRYKIAVDTARGLAFLHEECRDKVLHLDVKPQNILLDIAFRAKLADFGLSKLMERGNTQQTVTAMRGTPGYMAPEWFLNLPVTDRSDVFSYGMVLLELVGGRKNVNAAAPTSEEWYFPAWALRQAGIGCIREVVDKRLLAVLHNQAQDEYRDDALLKMERLIKVAFWCIQADANSRPSMATVVLMLEEHLQVPDPPLDMAYVPRFRPTGNRQPVPVPPTAAPGPSLREMAHLPRLRHAATARNTLSSTSSSSPSIAPSSSSCAADVTSLLSPR